MQVLQMASRRTGGWGGAYLGEGEGCRGGGGDDEQGEERLDVEAVQGDRGKLHEVRDPLRRVGGVAGQRVSGNLSHDTYTMMYSNIPKTII